MVKSIGLTKGYVALIDERDLSIVSQYKWHVKEFIDSCYAMTRVNGHKICMAYIILGNNKDKVEYVDGNPLNNCRNNLHIRNQITYENDYAVMYLNNGQYTKIDIDDVGKLSGVLWCAHFNGKKWSAKGRVNGSGDMILMHRFIMNPTSDVLIDHKSNNGLDNRKQNLRLCNNSQNQCNRGKSKNNKSGYKGVSWHKQNKKWTARIHTGSSYKCLGLFDNILEAAKAYSDAALVYHGEFAKVI